MLKLSRTIAKPDDSVIEIEVIYSRNGLCISVIHPDGVTNTLAFDNEEATALQELMDLARPAYRNN